MKTPAKTEIFFAFILHPSSFHSEDLCLILA